MIKFQPTVNKGLQFVIHSSIGEIGCITLDDSNNKWVFIFTHKTFTSETMQIIVDKLNELNKTEYALAA